MFNAQSLNHMENRQFRCNMYCIIYLQKEYILITDSQKISKEAWLEC